MDWIESVGREEFKREAASTQRKSKALTTEPRTRTVWVELPYSLGFCTVPAHDEVMKLLTPNQKVYRDKYPTRWIIRIGELDVCRDCFLAGADKDV